jgi:sporulation protein YlmC with PRC-barrel domain
MKVSSLSLILLVTAMLAVGTWAGAADESATGQAKMDRPAATNAAQSESFQPNVMKATDLIGMKIVNRQNEDLGKVEEIVLNPERNKIAYGVVSTGGILGMGEKLHAIPWTAFEKKPGETALMLDKSKDALNNAPGFDKSNWPDMANPRWKSEVDRYYAPGASENQSMKDTGRRDETAARDENRETAGNEMAANEPRTDRSELRSDLSKRIEQAFESRKVSEIIGMDVNNPKGDHLGDLEDVAIDMREGRPVFGIVGLTGNKMAAVPWSSLNIQPQTKTALLDSDPQTLESLAFNEDNFPNLSSREYASNVYSKFNREPYWSTYGYVGPSEGQGQMSEEKRSAGWGAEGDYARKFDPNTVTTMKGTVQSVGFFTPQRGAHAGERLRVRTDDGKTITVHLGPRSYLHQQNVSFKKGDQIEVTGSRADIAGREVILASHLKKGDQTIQLRDDKGKPLWTTGATGKTGEGMKEQPKDQMKDHQGQENR